MTDKIIYMPGYRLHHLARRASIQLATAPCMVSSQAEYRRGDYHFARERSDDVPLERSKPIESWGMSLLGGLGIVIFIIATFVVLGAAT